MRILVADQFFECLISLPHPVQKATLDFRKKFQANSRSASIHLEPISTFKDGSLRTARITQGYRAILGVVQERDEYYLLWVANHDDAMRWAANKRFDWNRYTNSPQLFTLEEVQDAPAPAPAPEPHGPFAEMEEEVLLQLGVPAFLLEEVRALDGMEALEALEPRIPPSLFEPLFRLLEGEDLAPVLSDLAEASAAEEGADSPATLRFYVDPSEDQLEELLSHTFEKWRIFLHPSQRVLVQGSYRGPVRVTGGAGTGKTVAAVHRLKVLHDLHPAAPKAFLTYTNALCTHLKGQIGMLRVPEEAVSLKTLDAMAKHLAQDFGLVPTNVRVLGLPGSPSPLDVWNDVLLDEVTALEPEALVREAEQVIQFHNLSTREAYMAQPRTGMGDRLTRKQRLEVWSLYEAYQKHKEKRAFADRADLFNRVTDYLNAHPEQRPFRHVMVDEVQDCSNVEVRFVRALAPEEPNDLFLVGDPFQSIYRRRLVFSQCGVHIRGKRSRRLKVNYRTTEEIRRFATAALKQDTRTNFDEEAETLSGYVSLARGPQPEYLVFDTEAEEWAFLFERLAALRQREGDRLALREVVFAARTKAGCKEIVKRLHLADIRYYDLAQNVGRPDGVQVSTFHALKGLEYKAVFLTGISASTYPFLPRNYPFWPEVEQAQFRLTERALLYTAMTRAVKHLHLTGHGERAMV